MGTIGNARHRCTGFALAARGDENDLVARQVAVGVLIEKFRHAFHQAQFAGNPGDAMHRPARCDDLAVGLRGGAGDGNHAAEIGGKDGDGDAVFGRCDQALEIDAHLGFRGAVTLFHRIGGIADQGERLSVRADFLEAFDVGWRRADGGRIDLPVPGMDDAAGGRFDQ